MTPIVVTLLIFALMVLVAWQAGGRKLAGISAAAAALRRGGLVGMPTETVYGLAADATSGGAVAAIYAAKARPRFNPLIIHASSVEAAERLAVLSPAALALAGAFWPGPLTLVLPVAATGRVCELARAGLQTVALRMPGHPVALELIRAFGGPLAAPSAAPRSAHRSRWPRRRPSPARTPG